MMYPFIITFLNTRKANSVISKYQKIVSSSSENDSLLKEARKYNESLTSMKIVDTFSSGIQNTSEEYMSLLNVNRDGVMGYIKIPKIKINIPVYHGTSTEVLNLGAGHVESSSLPIGGATTHSIISAHRGLPSSNLFSDLDQLQIGDMFYIYVLDKKLAYKVDQIKVIEPYEIGDLTIIEGKDLVTLVTCTPYAINTHRLLVRGTRVKYDESVLSTIQHTTKLSVSNTYLLIGVIFSFLILLVVVLRIKIIQKKTTIVEKVPETIEILDLKDEIEILD